MPRDYSTIPDINLIADTLEKEYPDVRCTLKWRTPLELLISTQLSAQCTDARVNIVTPSLFERFPDAESFAEADESEIASYIFSVGLSKTKSHNIKMCCKRIVEVFGGRVPDNMEDLTSLAGTGRKTANLVLGELYHQPAYVVDTHVTRLVHRLGISNGANADIIERDLRRLMPPEDDNASERTLGLSHRLVTHGRNVCTARKPLCEQCCLRDLCREYSTFTDTN